MGSEAEKIIRFSNSAACRILGHDYARDLSREGHWVECRRCGRQTRRIGMERREKCP